MNFLLNRRMAEHLNAALAAISLIGTESAEQDKFWQERALVEALHALNMHMAWSSLVRHKTGETFLPQHMRQFTASEMLSWLANELRLPHNPSIKQDLILIGNRETLQEALLLLRSCAFTLGPNVRLSAQADARGIWFRVTYQVVAPAPPTLDALIEALTGSWRAGSAGFELRRAHDFLTMNGCELVYRVGETHCELAFYVQASAAARNVSTQQHQLDTDSQPTLAQASPDML
jgi:hypothetical protein